MDDGWDDDLDELDIASDNDGDDNAGDDDGHDDDINNRIKFDKMGEAPLPAVPPSTSIGVAMMDDEEERRGRSKSGWKDDNADLFSPGPTTSSTAVVEDGWNDDEVNLDSLDDDDDDDLNFDHDDWGGNNNNNNNNNGKESATISKGMDFSAIQQQQQQQQHQQLESQPLVVKEVDSQPNNNDDDDDDDDLNFDDDDWGGTMDDSGGEVVGTANVDGSPNVFMTSTQNNPPSSYPPTDVNRTTSRIVQELEQYISSLDRIQSSINAILEFEYNTIEKANELVQYYTTRPQLADYTRNKELSRMNYQVVLPNGDVEMDKQKIVDDCLLPNESIIARASNQSLLADLIQVLTGDDLIVRPQYLAGCVAAWCQFTIHLRDNDDDNNNDDDDEMVTCQARLRLSLPTEKGDRIEVADVAVSVVFAPYRPMVEYKVHKVDVLLQDFHLLASTAEFLTTMEGHLNDIPGHYEEVQLRNAPSDIFRDAFMENSQRFLSRSSQGMKSAWQQMDSVINIKQKLQTISSFIPDTDQIMLAAEEETVAFAEARRREHEMMEQQQRQQQQQQQTLLRQKATHPHVHRPHIQDEVPPPSLKQPPPSLPHATQRNPQQPLGYNSREQQLPQQHQQPRPSNDTSRPKSILGGLFQTLAKSVAIPDDDPAIYGAAPPPPPPSQHHHSIDGHRPLYHEPPPSLCRKEDSAESQMLLYRREENQYQQPSRGEHATMATAPPSKSRPRPLQQQPLIVKQEVQPSPALNNRHDTTLSKISHHAQPSSKQVPMPSNVVGNVADYLDEVQESPPSSIAHGEKKIGMDDEYHFEGDSQIHLGRNDDIVASLRQPDRPVVEEEEDVVADGWDDDGIDDLDVDDIGLDTSLTVTGDSEDRAIHEGAQISQCTILDTVNTDEPGTFIEMTYNPEDDIVETRKRWRNERPYRPYITG